MADSTCPSCGAPISGSASTCPFCGSPIRSSSASSQQAEPPRVQRPVEEPPEEEIEVSQAQPQRNISREEMMDPVSQQQGFPGDMQQPQASGGRSRMMKIIILIAVLVIVFFLFRSCSGGGGDSAAPKKKTDVVQTSNTNAPAANGSISVGTGLDGNQSANANANAGDLNAFYARMKQQASVANQRYASAWKMIPSDIRGELQQSISALPRKIDMKCKDLARQYMTTNEDLERRAIYLKCSMDHENVVTKAIERYARDYRMGSAGNFPSYIKPQELLDRQWVYR